MFISLKAASQKTEQELQLVNTIWLAGRKVTVEYNPEYDETFIIPTNTQGKFRKGNTFANYVARVAAIGFDITGGHEYSIAVAGDLFGDLLQLKAMKEFA